MNSPIFFKLNEEQFTLHLPYKHSGTFANRKYEELSYAKYQKMNGHILVTLLKMRPHYSQSSHENATPSDRTSPLASYKEVSPGLIVRTIDADHFSLNTAPPRIITLLALRAISIQFLLVISILCKTEWSWELRTWSHKMMNLLDILSTSPHYFCRKWIGATNENSNLISGFKELKMYQIRLRYNALPVSWRL